MRNSLFYFYSIEVVYRYFYIVISFIFCVIIAFLHVQILLLVETYPFLQFSSKKFLVTQTTDLFDVVWILIFSTSLLFVFPLFFYQIVLFSKNSWYEYQTYFIYKLLLFSLLTYIFSLILCYFYFLPALLDFLSQWEIKQSASILNVEIEFRILNYINWILSFRYIFCFLFYIILFFFFFFHFLLELNVKYNLLKFHRNLFIFLNTFFLFFVVPSDILLQFFIIFFSFIFYEILFFILCYKCNSIRF
uniref:Sec-independent protein translocase n=1 Tax=Sarcopeltis skottsbergii TaxID=2765380 RepID=A0A7M1VID6_SARSK|nr:Sec-independent protein translocase [Sarcopeltis skottsbergii]QOS04477.1 Sec-independent protein translocase [Sarcopeltis skottsbergii]